MSCQRLLLPVRCCIKISGSRKNPHKKGTVAPSITIEKLQNQTSLAKKTGCIRPFFVSSIKLSAPMTCKFFDHSCQKARKQEDGGQAFYDAPYIRM